MSKTVRPTRQELEAGFARTYHGSPLFLHQTDRLKEIIASGANRTEIATFLMGVAREAYVTGAVVESPEKENK